ncbi:UDP-N-acetylglucosamine 2-epimerase (non-hydrolyzing) [Euhalothece natronophila Z-M001]|uniref:UDP-N-acetylglucosamine 2-epimerase (non-hydrolyzing) n=1 Tax=Euhalothece natronophila Z-M001 TaxID=522448 RepID=A0A5B8NIW0_9CHRO|nr:UDP-N-acetylglucosamine 2-epimerase (non-hydrolyzing) [Euhalothece natronophila]QDZ39172.1 UDP-N-acetylglucosamine 2-epimerase (non-hydrolyzing) [Euhalothece natronophila Z-M001]
MNSCRYKVGITLGTRPEAIKLAPVIKKCQQSPLLDTSVILTGQHREMVAQVMELFQLQSNQDLEIMQAEQTLSDITCRSLQGLEKLFCELKPDLVMTQGDTTTAFAATLAAFYQQIPIAHVEAGLRSNHIYNPYPEEANRRLISQLAQLNFAPTQAAVKNLQKSGVVGEIHLTGNTVIDALLTMAQRYPPCNISKLNWNQYRVLLATVHRRENWGEPLTGIIEGFQLILDKFPDTALLLPLHRNPKVRNPIKATLGNHPRVFLTEPLDYSELVGAMQRCYLLLTDSGGLQEEAPSLGKPVLVLRENTERTEAVQAGTARLVGTNALNILTVTSELLENTDVYEQMAMAINPFGDGESASRIVKIIERYLSTQNGH